jgi:hypothetical protein
MKFIKDNWKVAVFSGVVAFLVAKAFDVALALDWARVSKTFLEDPAAQADIAAGLCPFLCLAIFLSRFRFEFNNPDPLLRVFYTSFAGSYLAVFFFHLFMGTASPIFEDMQKSKYSFAIFTIVTLYYLFKPLVKTLTSGCGATRRVITERTNS